MPFDVNNIDVTVAANGIFGTTSAILSGLVDAKILNDAEIRVRIFLSHNYGDPLGSYLYCYSKNCLEHL